LISLTICAVWIKKLGIPFFGHNKKWLLIRGTMGMMALFLFFVTVKEMPLASATTIQYTSPIFTVLLATQIMREKVKPIQWVLFALAFIGILMIKGFDERISMVYLGLGMLSAFIAGIAYNAIMKCRDTDHPVTVVLYFPLIATPIMGTACLTVDWVMPVGMEWLILLTLGVFTQMAQIYMTKALHADHSSRIMPFKYFGVIYAILIGFLFFDEALPILSLIGIAVVIIAVVLTSFVKSGNKPVPLTQGVV
jgi:drug/metabolite transporter (DMT)-like permease